MDKAEQLRTAADGADRLAELAHTRGDTELAAYEWGRASVYRHLAQDAEVTA